MKFFGSKGALKRIQNEVKKMQASYAALSPEARQEHDKRLGNTIDKIDALATKRKMMKGIRPEVLHQKCDC